MTTQKGNSEQNMQNMQNMRNDSTVDFHGAAIIDNEGREVPITEEMVKQACEELEQKRQKQ